jgi:DNA-binding Lrp family transcriptional regulator
MVTIFVFIKTELGAEDDVMKELKRINEVKQAHKLYGVYDIIARIEAENMEDLKNIISSKLRRLLDIRSTITMITY